MNVYDEVNNLARALKECREFTEYKEAKDKVKSVEGLRTKIDEFEKIRYEEQLLALQGEKQSEEKLERGRLTITSSKTIDNTGKVSSFVSSELFCCFSCKSI